MFGVAGLGFQRLAAQATGGEAKARHNLKYGLWALHWVAGHLAGGVVLGVALGWLGAWLSPSGRAMGIALLSAGCLAGALHQLQIIRLPLPQLQRQVTRTWMHDMPWNLVALGYGLQLGCGVATRIKIATTYAMLGCALLSGSVAAGGLILGIFGVMRSVLPVWLGPRLASPQKSLVFALAFDAHEGRVNKINGFVLLGVAVLLVSHSWRFIWG